MTAELTTQQNPMEDFKQRVLEKLKTDIGSLMPDEVLSSLVQQAVKDQFFKKRTIPKPGRSTYSTETVESLSWFQEEISRQVEPILKTEIAVYVNDNQHFITAAIKEFLDKEKMTAVMAAVIGDRVRDGFALAAGDLMLQLRNSGVIRW
jgi:hypothetical protein